MSEAASFGPGVEAQQARVGALHASIRERYGDDYAAQIAPFTQALLDAGREPSDIFLWFGAPTGWLDGRVPADVIATDPDAVRDAVEQIALGPW